MKGIDLLLATSRDDRCISGAAASAPKDVTARFWVSVHGIRPDHVQERKFNTCYLELHVSPSSSIMLAVARPRI